MDVHSARGPLVLARLRLEHVAVGIGNVVAVVVSLPIGDPWLDPSASHPSGETTRMVVTPVIFLGEISLAIGGSTELSTPNDDFDLEVLLRTPDDGGGPGGPYLERAADLIDPWGNPFEILLPPGTVNHSFDIISWGEGGEQGGEGPSKDITQ